MITAVDETVDYILEADRESEEPTVFLLKTLDLRRFLQVVGILEKVFSEGKPEVSDVGKTGAFFQACLECGLVGWRNLRDGAGEEIAFEGSKSLVRLRPIWRIELAKAISDHNGISSGARKN